MGLKGHGMLGVTIEDQIGHASKQMFYMSAIRQLGPFWLQKQHPLGASSPYEAGP